MIKLRMAIKLFLCLATSPETKENQIIIVMRHKHHIFTTEIPALQKVWRIILKCDLNVLYNKCSIR